MNQTTRHDDHPRVFEMREAACVSAEEIDRRRERWPRQLQMSSTYPSSRRKVEELARRLATVQENRESKPVEIETPSGTPVGWAKQRGMIVSHGPIEDSLMASSDVTGGMEHYVVCDYESGRIVKIAQDCFFGVHHPLDFDRYLERWKLVNAEFDDDIHFHGFVRLSGDDFYRTVISQPFVEGREASDTGETATDDRAAIDHYMREKGFYRNGRGASFTKPDSRLRATDARGANFVIRPDGTACPVDVNLERVEPEIENPNQDLLFKF